MVKQVLPRDIAGLHVIAGRYDALICDVWGVVHNGKAPFAPAIDALQAFRAASGPVILVTNAPRLAADVMVQFDRIGVPHDCYDALITSGEAARRELMSRAPAKGRPLPIYNLGPERDRAVRAGLNVALARAEDAKLVLCTGLMDDERETPDDYRALLKKFRARRLPLLCANPDIQVRRGESLVYCAGAIARAYEKIGGKVLYFGKPHRPMLEYAWRAARGFGPAQAPLFAGDGLETDIKGANTMGWDALFVLSGLHGAGRGDSPTSARRLRELLRRYGVSARWSMRRLSW